MRKNKKILRRRFSVSAIFKYLFLIIASFISVFPFYWMIMAATNKSVDIVKGKIFFGSYLMENVKTLIETTAKTTHVGTAFWNSLRNASVATLLSLLICSLAGYGFEVFRDRGKDWVMRLLLLSMMVPFAAILVPLFRMFSSWGLQNSMLGVILPGISTAFLIFLFRQSTQSFPRETIQAARVDGLGEFGIFFRIYVPIMKPTFAAAATVTFMGAWNSYLWPLIILQSEKNRTMPMMISALTAGYTTDYGILMLAVLLTTLPTMVLFFALQRSFVEGILGSSK